MEMEVNIDSSLLKVNKKVLVGLVYLAMLLDNMLMTTISNKYACKCEVNLKPDVFCYQALV